MGPTGGLRTMNSPWISDFCDTTAFHADGFRGPPPPSLAGGVTASRVSTTSSARPTLRGAGRSAGDQCGGVSRWRSGCSADCDRHADRRPGFDRRRRCTSARMLRSWRSRPCRRLAHPFCSRHGSDAADAGRNRAGLCRSSACRAAAGRCRAAGSANWPERGTCILRRERQCASAATMAFSDTSLVGPSAHRSHCHGA